MISMSFVEQHNDDGWNAVSQTTKAVWSSQLWGISNAGDYRSVALRKQVDKGRKLVDEWARLSADGGNPADVFLSGEQDRQLRIFRMERSGQ